MRIYLPSDVVFLIADYAATYTLCAWVDLRWIVWSGLSLNSRAIDMLQEHPEKICWSNLSSNPTAMHLLRANLDKIDWESLSMNPAAIDLLLAHPDKIVWSGFASNEAAIDALEQDAQRAVPCLHVPITFDSCPEMYNLDRLMLQQNCHPRVVEMLKRNVDELDWMYASSNSGLMDVLEAHRDCIELWSLADNVHPRAIEILRENIDNLKNSDEIYVMSRNPGIFEATISPDIIRALMAL